MSDFRRENKTPLARARGVLFSRLATGYLAVPNTKLAKVFSASL
jgi:hypothetical protein